MSRFVAVTAAAAAFAVAAPALAVGLGPLAKEGSTNGPRKAFYLTLINPYNDARKFHTQALDLDDHPIERVKIVPETTILGGNNRRRIIVIAGGLAPGEQFTFRVCASEAEFKGEAIHARVCSKLTAERVAAVRG